MLIWRARGYDSNDDKLFQATAMSESDNWDLPVFSPDSEEQENIELDFLPVIPEWIHEECQRRAHEQWKAMLPVTGFDEDSQQYHTAQEPVTSVTEEQFRGVQIVQALYQKPLVSPTGEVVELNDDILAWWAEYSSQCTFFPGKGELEEAQQLVAEFFQDGERFTMRRWFEYLVETDEPRKPLKTIRLN